ncbi:MAG: hypothetical protein HY763_10615 [Planctomycetes bacterium]|nr:hypothetical protein [Planctomycetota bacterium]
MIAEADLEVSVCYGLGASCVARFSRSIVVGLPARDLVQMVLDTPQSTEPAARTARVLGDVVRSARAIDVEVAAGATEMAGPGRPITFDDIVLPGAPPRDAAPLPDKLTVLVSEAYRGG